MFLYFVCFVFFLFLSVFCCFVVLGGVCEVGDWGGVSDGGVVVVVCEVKEEVECEIGGDRIFGVLWCVVDVDWGV